MGEIAEAMLDGTLCSICGVYLDVRNGWPDLCPACHPDERVTSLKKVQCHICDKYLKSELGVKQHIKDVHNRGRK